MNKIVAIIFAVAILGSAFFLGRAYKTRGDRPGIISVTGLGSVDFESDEIIWTGEYSVKNKELSAGFGQIQADREKVEAYLLNKGVAAEDISFNQVSTYENQRNIYSSEGKYIGSEFEDYNLSQEVVVSSNNLDLVAQISREISELLNDGVQIRSNNPKYYYSKLDELKLTLIEQASENGRIRAEQIARNSGSALDGLRSANLGVFQILGYNSGESYSWSGTFNTSSRRKTASITVKMDFQVE
jgi:hypothetical protein